MILCKVDIFNYACVCVFNSTFRQCSNINGVLGVCLNANTFTHMKMAKFKFSGDNKQTTIIITHDNGLTTRNNNAFARNHSLYEQ